MQSVTMDAIKEKAVTPSIPLPSYSSSTLSMNPNLWLRFFVLALDSCPLLLDTLHSSLSCSLGLRTLGVHLVLEYLLTRLLGLGLVDMLDESTLVLEGVTLAQVIELVVKMLVDLTAGTVLDEETAEDTETTHPEHLARHTSIL